MTNGEDGTVSVVDLERRQVDRVVAVGAAPHDLRMSPDGRAICVANVGDGSVSVVDASTLAEVARISVGPTPVQVGFTPDGRRLFVSLRDANAVAVVDVAARRALATIPVGRGPIQVFATPDGRWVYAANEGTRTRPDRSVSVIDAALVRVVATGAWAQQPGDPHHPPGGGAAPAQPQAVPPPPSAPPSLPSSAGGMPMMQMMMGRGGMMPMTGEAGAQGDRRMGPPGAMTGGDAPGAPINVIINIGPGIRVDAAEAGPPHAGAMRGPGVAGRPSADMMRGVREGMRMQGPGAAGSASTMLPPRIEGRLAFLRAELGITEAQREAWERYAQAARAAAAHDREARQAPAADDGALARLARAEAVLAASLDRVRAIRAALEGLLPALTDEQRRTLEQLLPMAMMMGPGPGSGMGMGPPAVR